MRPALGRVAEEVGEAGGLLPDLWVSSSAQIAIETTRRVTGMSNK